MHEAGAAKFPLTASLAGVLPKLRPPARSSRQGRSFPDRSFNRRPIDGTGFLAGALADVLPRSRGRGQKASECWLSACILDLLERRQNISNLVSVRTVSSGHHAASWLHLVSLEAGQVYKRRETAVPPAVLSHGQSWNTFSSNEA